MKIKSILTAIAVVAIANVSNELNANHDQNSIQFQGAMDVRPTRLTTKPVYSLAAEAEKAKMVAIMSGNAIEVPGKKRFKRTAKYNALKLHFNKR